MVRVVNMLYLLEVQDVPETLYHEENEDDPPKNEKKKGNKETTHETTKEDDAPASLRTRSRCKVFCSKMKSCLSILLQPAALIMSSNVNASKETYKWITGNPVTIAG